MKWILPAAALSAALLAGAAFSQSAVPSDPQIAHIAYTAGVLDIDAGKQALAKTKDSQVKAFAEQMVRDHQAVNDQALALVKKAGITPEDNTTSQSLTMSAKAKRGELAKLDGAAFDKAYIDNEIAYHKTVNGALSKVLIPNAKNPELKTLLENGLKLFTGHEMHAEMVAKELK